MARPSRTALKVARFMLLLDTVPRMRAVLPAGAATTAEAILSSSGAVPQRHVDMMRSQRTVRAYAALERVLGEGQLLWFGVRKRWMHYVSTAAIADGVSQVLVVGAGFDPLAALLAGQHPDTFFLEIDAPATAEPKRAGVQAAGLARPNHQVMSADLAVDPLPEVLGTTRWRTHARSLVLAEGLLMYLHPADVERFFTAVRGTTGPGSRIAFTSVDADEQGRPRVGFSTGKLNRFIQLALRLAGEPMHFGMPPSQVPAFLAPLGYTPLEQPTADDLRARFLDPHGLHSEPLAPYEHLVLAARNA